jgi:hypothetical protein
MIADSKYRVINNDIVLPCRRHHAIVVGDRVRVPLHTVVCACAVGSTVLKVPSEPIAICVR